MLFRSKSSQTIVAKAVDVEHNEEEIIGHIYACAFTDKDGNKLDIQELTALEASKLDAQDMHIEIASVVYKTRFPALAKEIKDGEWKVSMETYYTSYDILVGSTIMTLEEAQLMGFDVANESLYGKQAKIVKAGKVVDQGKVAKVLRGLCFSGVGIVKNPANKPSIIFEATAGIEDLDVIEFNFNDLNKNNNVTSSNIEIKDFKEAAMEFQEGICVSYIKEGVDSLVKDQDSKVVRKEWCNKYDKTCPVAGDFKSEKCLDRLADSEMMDEEDMMMSENSSLESYIKEVALNKLNELYKEKEIDKLISIINSYCK